MCRIRAEGGCVKVRKTFWNALKGGRTEKKVGETKILNGGKPGQGVGPLKKIWGRGGGAGQNRTTLRTMTDKLNIDELEKAKNGLSSLKSKADWLDFHTLKLIPADLVEVM